MYAKPNLRHSSQYTHISQGKCLYRLYFLCYTCDPAAQQEFCMSFPTACMACRPFILKVRVRGKVRGAPPCPAHSALNHGCRTRGGGTRTRLYHIYGVAQYIYLLTQAYNQRVPYLYVGRPSNTMHCFFAPTAQYGW